MTSVGKIDDVSTKNDVRVRNIFFPKVKTLFYVNVFISCHFAHFYDFYTPRQTAGTLFPPPIPECTQKLNMDRVKQISYLAK